jgi:PAS domain-containing protein
VTARSDASAAVEKAPELTGNLRSEPMAICICDLAGRVRSWSAGAERLFGSSASEASGKSAGALMGIAPAEWEGRCWELAYAGGEWRGPLRLTVKGGQPLDSFCRLVLLRDAAGTPDAIAVGLSLSVSA